MRLSNLSVALLVALVSVPGFLIGHELRQGESGIALLLFPLALAVVLVASALMQQRRAAVRATRQNRRSR